MNTELIKRAEALEAEAKRIRENIKKTNLAENLAKQEAKVSLLKAPELGEEYYCFDYSSGEPIKRINNNTLQDRLLIARGEAFKTKHACMSDDAKRQLKQEIVDWKIENDPKSFIQPVDFLVRREYSWDSYGYVINPDGSYRKFVPNAIYFSSEEKVKACIEHFGSRLDLLKEGF